MLDATGINHHRTDISKVSGFRFGFVNYPIVSRLQLVQKVVAFQRLGGLNRQKAADEALNALVPDDTVSVHGGWSPNFAVWYDKFTNLQCPLHISKVLHDPISRKV